MSYITLNVESRRLLPELLLYPVSKGTAISGGPASGRKTQLIKYACSLIFLLSDFGLNKMSHVQKHNSVSGPLENITELWRKKS